MLIFYNLLVSGYKESAFGHAIASAGVAFSVSKACSQGNLLSCGCGFQYDDQVNFIPSKDADYTFDERSVTKFSGFLFLFSCMFDLMMWSNISII